MTFEIYKDSAQFSQFITLIIFSPLGIVVTALRFVAVRRVARKVGSEDWLALIATIFFILTNLAGLMAIGILNGRQITEEVAESPSDYSHMRKWDIAGLYFYFAHTLSAKLSVLSFYHRLFGITSTRARIWIYILGGAQTVLFIVFCTFQALQCRPLQRYFDLSVPGHCTDEGTVILGGEVPNSIIDFAMVILAMILIRPLQLSPHDKARLIFLFGLGFIVGIIGFVKIAITYSSSAIYALSMVALWTGVQMFAALLCCSLPMYNVFLPVAAGFWERFSGYARRGSRHWSTTQSSKDSRSRSVTSSQRRDWEELLDNNGAKGLAYPGSTYQADTHILSDFSQSTDLEGRSIHVQRQFDVS